MKNIIKSIVMVCLLSLLTITVCFADGVQLSDSYGGGFIDSRYNYNIGATGYAYLQTENFGYRGMINDYQSLYTSYVSSDNIINYICNSSGYVDSIQIVSSNPENNRIEAYVLLDVITDGTDADYIEDVTAKSTATSSSYYWYCSYTARTYYVDTSSYDNSITTTIYAVR